MDYEIKPKNNNQAAAPVQKEIEINALMFLAEVLGYHKKLYKDIDRLYQTDKYRFYESAKNNHLYNSVMFKEGTLLQEEYSKKALGILLHINEPKISEAITAMIKKGWPYCYTYAEKNKTFDLVPFITQYMKKQGKDIDDFNDDEMFAAVFITWYLSVSQGKEIAENPQTFSFVQVLDERQKKYKTNKPTALVKASDSLKTKAQKMRLKLYEQYGDLGDAKVMMKDPVLTDFVNTLDYVFKYEQLNGYSLYNDVMLSPKEVEELLEVVLYHMLPIDTRKLHLEISLAKIDIDKMDLMLTAQNLIYLIRYRMTLRAYRQAKDYYFRNNKETMFIELETIEKERDKLEAENRLQAQRIKQLEDELAAKDKEIGRLQRELAIEKETRPELNSLREFMFGLSKEALPETQDLEKDISKLKDGRYVLVGGYDTWLNKLKEKLPKFRFVAANAPNFDSNILKNADAVFIYTGYLDHATYYKVMSIIRKNQTKLYYLSQINEARVFAEMANLLTQ